MSFYHGWKADGSKFKECAVCGERSSHRFWNNDEVEDGWELCQTHWKVFKRETHFLARATVSQFEAFVAKEKKHLSQLTPKP